ncbi:MAG: FAD-binding oxidoreductase [Bacteroidetes bacterium]|nr:FAD-binding oxidoreductase [Bacteroidota bacterium]
MKKALILGGGIQGLSSAFALLSEGFSVTIIDKAASLFNRASLRNEGKIHLGFVYANDPTGKTPVLMLRSALRFAPGLDLLTGSPFPWKSLVSNPFTYTVMTDTMVPADRLFACYDQLAQDYHRELSDPELNYLGFREPVFWEPISCPVGFAPDRGLAWAKTCELALDLVGFRTELLTRLNGNGDRVQIRLNEKVMEVHDSPAGFRVVTSAADGSLQTYESDLVVNCLWEDRIRIDQQVGLVPDYHWVNRLKYRLMIRLPDQLPVRDSFTYVLGAYGDLVTYPHSEWSYLSWYPVVMKGWSNDISTPSDWEAACNGLTPEEFRNQLISDVFEVYKHLVPGIENSQVGLVDAGIIFSRGSYKDITLPDSELHERYDIGVQKKDGYFSISTGKFTSAPYHALQLKKQLGSALAGSLV